MSGTQLDGRLVEIFIEVLAGKDVRFRHGEDADFDAELELDKRVARLRPQLPDDRGQAEQRAPRRRPRPQSGTRAPSERASARPHQSCSTGVRQRCSSRRDLLGRADVDADAGAELEAGELRQARHDVDVPVEVLRARGARCAPTG